MAIFKSRKFYVFLLDFVLSVSILVVNTYFVSEKEFLLALIALMQIFFGKWVEAIATEDAAQINALTHVTQRGIIKGPDDQ
jgi:hypothetical protein